MVERYRPNQRERQIRYRARPQSLTPGRRALLRALRAEYLRGNSVSKLYVPLLARAVVEQEPRLLQEPADERLRYSRAMADFLECGVSVKVPEA